MKYFPRLVNIVILGGCAGIMPFATGVGNTQLVSVVMQEGPALLLHSSQGYLGVDIRDIDNDRAAALKLKDPRGAEIITVDHDAPAGKAGLKLHDVILQMNGQVVEGEQQFRRMLRETPAGRTVSLLISRDGQQQTMSIQLADREQVIADSWPKSYPVPDPDEDATVNASPTLPSSRGFVGGRGFFGSLTMNPLYVGVDLDPVGSQLADYFGVKDGTGLLVKRVEDNSPAAVAGLKAGDVITKLNGETLATNSQWLKAIHSNRGKQVQLTVVRNRKEQTMSMVAGDPKKKGDLEWPAFGPPSPAALAELRAQLDGLAGLQTAEMSQQLLDSLRAMDAETFAAEAREAMKSLDLETIEKDTLEQQKEMELLKKDSPVLTF
jgi:serine protease Do